MRLITLICLLCLFSIHSFGNDSVENNKNIELSIANSDDYKTHKDQFLKAANKLIRDKSCTANEIKDMGGFMKSQINHPNQPVYFTYCGGMNRNNRIYVDVSSGKIFK